MKNYKIIRNNSHIEYKNNKNNNLLKLKISSGIIYISLVAFTISNPQNFVSNVQDIMYTINEVFNNENDINNLSDTIKKGFEEFENKIEANIPTKYLNNYYNNIKSLKFYENSNDLNKFFDISGYYSLISNRIVSISTYKHTLFHELIHMSSSNNKYSGFSNGKIAIGLTEGYTEYLTLKLFGDEIETVFSYTKEIEVIEILNQIIGKDKMMQYYFTNDLESLKQELCNIYGTEKEVNKLIEDIDIFTRKKDYSKLDEIGSSLIKYSYLSEIKKDNNLNVNKKYKYLLDGLHYNYSFEQLENDIIEEICSELHIEKKDISFVDKNEFTQKK